MHCRFTRRTSSSDFVISLEEGCERRDRVKRMDGKREMKEVECGEVGGGGGGGTKYHTYKDSVGGMKKKGPTAQYRGRTK